MSSDVQNFCELFALRDQLQIGQRDRVRFYDRNQIRHDRADHRHEHSHLPEHGRVCKQEKICMSQMWEDTYLPGCGILQELSGYVLCIYRVWESPERIISGI